MTDQWISNWFAPDADLDREGPNHLGNHGLEGGCPPPSRRSRDSVPSPKTPNFPLAIAPPAANFLPPFGRAPGEPPGAEP